MVLRVATVGSCTRILQRIGKNARTKQSSQWLQGYATRSFSSGGSSDRNDLRDFLTTTFEIDAQLHNGIFKAMESVHGKDLKKEHFEAFGKEGIAALAASVEEEVAKRNSTTSRPFITLRISVPHHGTSFDLKWRVGESLLDVAQNNPDLLGEYMEGTCGGNMSCCTCHVYVEQPEFRGFLTDPDEGELDMIVRHQKTYVDLPLLQLPFGLFSNFHSF